MRSCYWSLWRVSDFGADALRAKGLQPYVLPQAQDGVAADGQGDSGGAPLNNFHFSSSASLSLSLSLSVSLSSLSLYDSLPLSLSIIYIYYVYIYISVRLRQAGWLSSSSRHRRAPEQRSAPKRRTREHGS